MSASLPQQHWQQSKCIAQFRSAQKPSLLTFPIQSLPSMPSDGKTIRLSLVVMKAKWTQKKDTIRQECNKLKAMRKKPSRRRKKSWTRWRKSVLLPFPRARHYCSRVGARAKRKMIRQGAKLRLLVPACHRLRRSCPSPPQVCDPPPPAPVLKSAAVVTPKVSGTACKGGKPTGQGVRERRPWIPPGEPAPDHKGKPDAHGELYPDFSKTDPRYCEACEQLRRGWKSATKAHRPKVGTCAWAPLSRKP